MELPNTGTGLAFTTVPQIFKTQVLKPVYVQTNSIESKFPKISYNFLN
jgi:hypothetical protein